MSVKGSLETWINRSYPHYLKLRRTHIEVIYLTSYPHFTISHCIPSDSTHFWREEGKAWRQLLFSLHMDCNGEGEEWVRSHLSVKFLPANIRQIKFKGVLGLYAAILTHLNSSINIKDWRIESFKYTI
ncbi:unnamed protein product [Lepidochelys kempii]